MVGADEQEIKSETPWNSFTALFHYFTLSIPESDSPKTQNRDGRPSLHDRNPSLFPRGSASAPFFTGLFVSSRRKQLLFLMKQLVAQAFSSCAVIS